MSRLSPPPSISEGCNHFPGHLTLRDVREQSVKSLRDVEAELGISRADLSKIERGVALPTSEQLVLLSEYYGVPASWKARTIWLIATTKEDAHADAEAGVG